MKNKKGIFSLLLISLVGSVSLTFAQPANDNCASAINLCSGQSQPGSTVGATADVCAGCSDGATAGGNFCFSLENTVWFSFTTNSTGGNASIDFSGLSFNSTVGYGTFLEASVILPGTACDESTYTLIGACESTINGNTTMNLTGLQPNTTYYLQVDGSLDAMAGETNPAEASFSVVASGTALQPEALTVNVTSDQPGTVCVNTPITFTADTSGCSGTSQIDWMVNGSTISSGTDNVLTTSALTDADQISATFSCSSSSTGCPVSSTTSNLVTVSIDDPLVDAGTDVVIAPGESVNLEGSGNGTYSWGPSEGLSSTTVASPVASPDATTTYTLTVTTPNNCTDTDNVTVAVQIPIYVPNTITPNDDGIHDIWGIGNIQNYPSAKVTIYDRWGQKIFNVVGYTTEKRWDGTHRGMKLPAGTYYYVIDLNTGGDADVYLGHVNIVY